MRIVVDPRIERILRLPEQDGNAWQADLDRFRQGDETLTRRSVGESTMRAVQRLLIFLGYSTASTGAFLIDGNFGRGTNRAVAQFQFENSLTRAIDRGTLCYACTWQTASAGIVAIPDAKLTPATLERMLARAAAMLEQGEVMCGSLDEALFHLDALHRRRLLTCREVFEKYAAVADRAVDAVAAHGVVIAREWLLAIIKQETSGIVRPRFEQHLLTRLNHQRPVEDFVELRYRSMSFGLGQILGENYRRVGAASARRMYLSSIPEQVMQIGRFLAASAGVAKSVGRTTPGESDFRAVARYYNGPGYEKHHYHESLATWFREFRALAAQ
ncbi:MAG TPA: N-acetylmuramidase domain-containing protein [Povalibacter sp.]|mgnify:CR=1 FL=1|uniref:N-acetylmuramidase domain-containing protein n=1 Tax=Povalibacter sp. TaxID=1962978 RepID=UPI002BEB9B36|nr:N-acetylmuramidase domain-containing protein [Povalibacter sp.]HMN43847.1 N-acetylmuramidase domain-containing protein [Povalibacter sp.]